MTPAGSFDPPLMYYLIVLETVRADFKLKRDELTAEAYD
jgi:hypothetical protein